MIYQLTYYINHKCSLSYFSPNVHRCDDPFPHFAWCLTIARTAFERVYSAQKDVRVKEWMLLVLNVAFYGRLQPMWSERFTKLRLSMPMVKEMQEEGLADRPKGGRHPQVSRQAVYRTKTIL